MEDLRKKLLDFSDLFNSKEFEEEFTYDGERGELGCTYTGEDVKFLLWSPVAESAAVNIYKEGTGGEPLISIPMEKGKAGVFEAHADAAYLDHFYTYSVTVKGLKRNEAKEPLALPYIYTDSDEEITFETQDPYARAVGVNGRRGMIVRLSDTDPEGFENDVKPPFDSFADAVIYEIHVRDFSMDKSSGMKNKGKFLAFTEHGTKNSEGLPTGVDYLKELGVTHIHLLPSYDYGSVDESDDRPQFNWGYDPENYNTPEGSYSTDPYDGRVRIREFKEMVASLHKDGIRVVMDVVYNHMFSALDSCFTKVMPNYYFRTDGMISSNGSGCGNETASDRSMVSKYIIDSVLYWAKEYHVDGFRFDLMAIHDIDTINKLKEELAKLDKSIIVYGEGWIGGPSVLDPERACFKRNAYKLKDVAVFNDDIRDAIKGSVMADEAAVAGFVNSYPVKDKEKAKKLIKRMRFAVTGAVRGMGFEDSYTNSPLQSISYVSAHDNWALWDKLSITMPDADRKTKVKANKLAAAIYMTAPGIPFFQAGEEILRSKPLGDGRYEDNSYISSDEINSIKWDIDGCERETLDFYKKLISLRKAHAALRPKTAAEVIDSISFADDLPYGVFAYEIKTDKEDIFLIFNGFGEDGAAVKLPDNNGKKWEILLSSDEDYSLKEDGAAVVDRSGALILGRK